MPIPIGMLGLAAIGAAWYFSKAEQRKREACMDDGMDPAMRAYLLGVLEDKDGTGKEITPEAQYNIALQLQSQGIYPKAVDCIAKRAIERGGWNQQADLVDGRVPSRRKA